MAAGDVVTIVPTSVNNAAYLTIQPGEGVEWKIDNIQYSQAMELYKTDGSNPVKVDSDTTSGGRFNMRLRCTNTVYYAIKNVSGSAAGYFSYDGVVTK